MSEEKEMFESHIKGESTSSGRFIRTSASTNHREFVLATDEVYQDVRLHILDARYSCVAGLNSEDILALKKCCDRFLDAHKNLKAQAK